jgi:glutaredoxin-like protein NrdH
MERPQFYSKKPCVQCDATERFLDKNNIPRDTFNLAEMPEKLEEFKEQGHMQAPVVEFNGERWSGFRPDKLGEIALVLSEIE